MSRSSGRRRDAGANHFVSAHSEEPLHDRIADKRAFARWYGAALFRGHEKPIREESQLQIADAATNGR
jgi:hypothetical protein